VLQLLPSYPCFLTGRILSGMGTGAASMVVPLFIAEMAPKEIRGSLISWYGFFIYLGEVSAYWLNFVVVKTVPSTDSAQWRISVGLQMLPATVMMVSIFFLPDSVRWLVKNGKLDQGLASLSYIRKASPTDPQLVSEFNEIIVSAEIEAQESGKWHEIFLPENSRRLAIGFCVLLFQMTSGTNLFTYYAPTIFESIGIKGQSTSLFATGLYGIIKCVVTVVYLKFFIDRVGRRPMFIQGAIGMGLCLLVLGLLLHFYPPNPATTQISHASMGMVALVFLYVIFFASSWGPTGWIYVGEIFPNRIREYCVAVSTCANWIGNLAVSKVVPVAIANIGWWMFIIFFFFNVINLVFAIVFIKETKKVSLEMMDEVFGKKRKDVETNINDLDDLDDLETRKIGKGGVNVEQVEHTAS
jgi:sugar porter (SP) family MFS transporter